GGGEAAAANTTPRRGAGARRGPTLVLTACPSQQLCPQCQSAANHPPGTPTSRRPGSPGRDPPPGPRGHRLPSTPRRGASSAIAMPVGAAVASWQPDLLLFWHDRWSCASSSTRLTV